MGALRRLGARGAPLVALLTAAAVGLLVGCAANEPFDPNSVENRKPTIRLSIEPIPGRELAPTSYYKRRFSWNATDSDGFVVEYYVSVRNDRLVPAPWDTTVRTDTTMTFVTDDDGNAEATIYLVCLDNRGALSDTFSRTIPLKNFPPSVGFLDNFDPLRNMQRELRDADGNILDDPSDPNLAETIYWNWGPMNFRMYAEDTDGMETVDPFYLYTVADVEPTAIYDEGDPLADPNTAWVRAQLDNVGEVQATFEFFVDALPGENRTLRVLVKDEADGGEIFTYSWVVREPASGVLYVPDNSSDGTVALYREALAAHLGEGNWDEYDFWYGQTDRPIVMVENLRKFDAVLWTDGGAASPNIRAGSTVPSGFLSRYLSGDNGAAEPGRLLLVSRVLTGAQTGLSPGFLATYLGISTAASPLTALRYPIGQAALGLSGALPDMTTARASATGGVGLAISAPNRTEAVYQMEYCTCYGDPRRPLPPYDPIVGVRSPLRATAPLARVVGIGLQLDNFDREQVKAAVAALLENELGVAAP